MSPYCVLPHDIHQNAIRALLERKGFSVLALQQGQKCLPSDIPVVSTRSEFQGVGVRIVHGGNPSIIIEIDVDKLTSDDPSFHQALMAALGPTTPRLHVGSAW